MAISRLRAGLSSPSLREEDRTLFPEMLSLLVRRRFRDYNLTESLEEANFNISQVDGDSSSLILTILEKYVNYSTSNRFRGSS